MTTITTTPAGKESMPAADKPAKKVRTKTSAAAAPKSETPPPRKAPAKSEKLIAMLRRPEGATIAAMMDASGWQQHSVRGFLAGTVKKKLGHTLVSETEEGGRVYRITDSGGAS